MLGRKRKCDKCVRYAVDKLVVGVWNEMEVRSNCDHLCKQHLYARFTDSIRYGDVSVQKDIINPDYFVERANA